MSNESSAKRQFEELSRLENNVDAQKEEKQQPTTESPALETEVGDREKEAVSDAVAEAQGAPAAKKPRSVFQRSQLKTVVP